MYAAIVPTLQRTSLLGDLLDALAAHDLVAEVLVVNNAEAPLTHASPKVRVIAPGRNIFVNAAWNLGVAETTSPRLAIVNDDVRLPVGLLEAAADRLDRGAGILGPDESCFGARDASTGPIRFRPAWWRTRAFGTLMLMDRASWLPVPEDLAIYFGDDYLFGHQTRPNYAFSGVHLGSHTSTTVSSAEFRGWLERDRAAFEGRYDDNPYARRFLLRSLPAYARRTVRRFARKLTGRLARRVRRLGR